MAQIFVVFYFKGIYVGPKSNQPHNSKLSTHSIDLRNLLFNFINFEKAKKWLDHLKNEKVPKKEKIKRAYEAASNT